MHNTQLSVVGALSLLSKVFVISLSLLSKPKSFCAPSASPACPSGAGEGISFPSSCSSSTAWFSSSARLSSVSVWSPVVVLVRDSARGGRSAFVWPLLFYWLRLLEDNIDFGGDFSGSGSGGSSVVHFSPMVCWL
ncbi:unnamed protein product [Arabidopsis lyrata]|nr:unnamed protein product [Arabidopsis lyrata]